MSLKLAVLQAHYDPDANLSSYLHETRTKKDEGDDDEDEDDEEFEEDVSIFLLFNVSKLPPADRSWAVLQDEEEYDEEAASDEEEEAVAEDDDEE